MIILGITLLISGLVLKIFLYKNLGLASKLIPRAFVFIGSLLILYPYIQYSNSTNYLDYILLFSALVLIILAFEFISNKIGKLFIKK